jgi:hypothetical protein
MCPSSGELTVSMRHLVLVTLYGWLAGMQGGIFSFHPAYQTWICCTVFLSIFISFFYMFRANMCPSSGETNVFMRHLVLVNLYGWLPGMQGMVWYGMVWKNSTLHTRQSSIESEKYQVSHKYSCFSWRWAHSRPKHVEKRNKHTKKNRATNWLYLQDYTRIHGQQNIKKLLISSFWGCTSKNNLLRTCGPFPCFVSGNSLMNCVHTF